MADHAEDADADVWSLFLRTHAAVRKCLENEMRAERGLSGVWYEVLLHLSRAEGHMLRIQDLADSILLTQSGVSRLVDRIEAAGLVRREPSSSDRRAVYVALTPKGQRVFRNAAKVHGRGIARHFVGQLTEQELSVLHRAFGKILRAASADVGTAACAKRHTSRR